MDNSLHKLSELALKHLKGELDAAETAELNAYLEASEDNQLFFENLTNRDNLREKLEWVYTADQQAMWKKIVAATPQLHKGRTIFMRHTLRYAAAVFLIAALGVYFFMNRQQKPNVANTTIPASTIGKTDIPPGGNRATLTLANGQTIILDSAQKGNLATEGKTNIIKTADGQLAYDSKDAAADIYYNTVSTPKGGQYQLTLSDGSKIWMNAASALRFPTAFKGRERLIELDGEAYFEVARHAQMPFIVKLKNGTTIQVLGTHFNIMAYAEEQEIKTTLIEGAVKVSQGSSEAIIKPGQQAISSNDNDLRINKFANIEETIAWKNGVFQFENADLKTVMRQIARWYDVEISYEGQLPEKRFTGSMSRNLKASELLSGIEYVGVHFKIEGKKILVLP